MLQMAGMNYKIIELIDFYHAVQHLYAFTELKKQWSRKKRKQWASRQRGLLKQGKTEEVILNLRVSSWLYPSFALVSLAHIRLECIENVIFDPPWNRCQRKNSLMM